MFRSFLTFRLGPLAVAALVIIGCVLPAAKAQETPAPAAEAATASPAEATAGETTAPEEAPTPAGNLWQLPAVESPTEVPVEEAAPAPAPTSQGEDENSPQVDRETVQADPIARTALHSAQTNAETLVDGPGGIAAPLESVFLPARNRPAGAGFHFGPATIYPVLSFGASTVKTSYSGINVDREETRGDLGASFHLSMGEPATGKTIRLNYAAQYHFGDVQSDARDVGQQLSFRASLGFTKLTLGLGINYDGLSGTNRDFGRDVARNFLTISFTSSYAYSPKTSLDWDVSLPVREFTDGVSSAGVTSTTFFNYQYTPKTTVGLGVTGGILQVESADTQQFGQLLSRVSFAATGPLAFSGMVGIEWRDAGAVQQLTPIFGLSAGWTPRLGTAFTLSAERRVQNSATNTNSNYTSTNVSLSLLQRLGGRVTGHMSVGYEDAQYESLQVKGSNDRHDQLTFGQVGLSAVLTKNWTGTLFYSYTHNDSSQFSFETARGQAQMSFNF